MCRWVGPETGQPPEIPIISGTNWKGGYIQVVYLYSSQFKHFSCERYTMGINDNLFKSETSTGRVALKKVCPIRFISIFKPFKAYALC
jgi:hypothetical protein